MSVFRPVSSRAGNPWLPRVGAAIVWACVAASAVYWVMKFQPGQATAPESVAEVTAGRRAAPVVIDNTLVARALGMPATTAAAAAPLVSAGPSRFALIGVVAEPGAAKGAGQGAALIAVDGRPPRPFGVGREVEPGLFLQTIEPRRVQLGRERSGPASLTLELPPARR